MTELESDSISDKVVCRTAPTPQGLLNVCCLFLKGEGVPLLSLAVGLSNLFKKKKKKKLNHSDLSMLVYLDNWSSR